MADKVFISYRREDEQGYAVRLYERLAETFGKERLFFDVDSIPPGFDFVSYIETQIALSDVVLVVIGRNWLNATDEHGQRRLDNPEDFVRIEVELALEQGKHVIPVLVQGAQMPLSTQLPPKLRPLARRNAFFASHVGFRAETERLIVSLQGMTKLIEAERAHAKRAATAPEATDAATSREPLRREPAGQPHGQTGTADRGPVLHVVARDIVVPRQDGPEQVGVAAIARHTAGARRADADGTPQEAVEPRQVADREEAERAAAPDRYVSTSQARLQKAQAGAPTRDPAWSPPRKAADKKRVASAPRSFGSRFLLALLSMGAIAIVIGAAYLGFDAVSSWPGRKTASPPAMAATPPAAEAPSVVQPESLIGLTIADAQDSTIASFGVEDREAATIVTDVDTNKAAFRAGIKIGFLILKVNGVDKFTRQQVLEAISEAIGNGDASVSFTMRTGWMNSFDATKTVELGPY